MSDLLPTRGYTYDDASELTDLTYSDAQNAPLAGYHWDYDAAGLVSDEYSLKDTSGTPASYAGWAEAEYNYDADAQLSTTGSTDAVTYAGSWNSAVSNASVTYDANGNRNDVTPPSGAATTTGAGNQLLYDGQYYYQYDAAGNRIAQWVDTNGHPEGSPQPNDTDITTYTWDNGGQLTAVKYFGAWNAYSLDNPDWKVDYTFDALGRMVSRTPTGITGEQTEYYVYDGQNLALVLDAAGDVVEREFYAPAASSPLPGGSQGEGVLASEVGPATMGTQSVGTVDWYLPDNQGTVRDVVELDGTTTSEVDHLVYDGFGNITTQTTPIDQPRFTYAGMPLDSASGMYDDGVRNYAATDAVFASLDPLGFNAGQTNLSEYCGNNPTNYTDPSGEMCGLDGLAAMGLGALIGGLAGAATYTVGAAVNCATGASWQQSFSWSGFFGAAAGGAVMGGMLGALCDPATAGAAIAMYGSTEAGYFGAMGVASAYCGGYTGSCVRQALQNPDHRVDTNLADAEGAAAAPWGVLNALGPALARRLTEPGVGELNPAGASTSGPQTPVEESPLLVHRAVRPNENAYRLSNSKDEGVSVFDADYVEPNDITAAGFQGAVKTATKEQIAKYGLRLVKTEGDPSLPPALRENHWEIRPGPDMNRDQFKKALKALSAAVQQ